MSLVKNTGVAENRVCFPSLKRRPEELLARLSYLGKLDTGLLHRAHQRGRIIYMFHCLAENIHSCLIWLMTPAQISSWCDRSMVRIIKVLWWSTGPYWIFFSRNERYNIFLAIKILYIILQLLYQHKSHTKQMHYKKHGFIHFLKWIYRSQIEQWLWWYHC